MNIPVSKFFYLFSNLCDPTAVEVASMVPWGALLSEKKWAWVWMRSACFKLKLKRLVVKLKRLVSKPGAWLAWGAGETD